MKRSNKNFALTIRSRCVRDLDRAVVFVLCVLQLGFSLSSSLLVAQSTGVQGAGDSPRRYVSEAPSPMDLSRAIGLASSYLEHVCGTSGKFVYRVRSDSGQESRSYNIVRHAGAIYALAMLNHVHPDQQAVKTMVRAAVFMRQNYIGPGVRKDQLVVWSKPLSTASVADLGATGLGLVGLSAVREADSGSVPLEQLQALGRFLLFLQRSDGSFISKYRMDTGADPNFESLYYPGEAALGFLSLYDLDHSLVWLNAAARALSYLARQRAGQAQVPPDHWALIATAKFLPLYAQSNSPASREELIQHAMQVCRELMKGQLRNPANQGLDGSFDPSGRTAPTATRMEGLLAAREFLPSGALHDAAKQCVEHGIAFLLRTQIGSGTYSGGVPEAYVKGIPEASDIRIDYVQHAMCAWIRYQQLYQRPK